MLNLICGPKGSGKTKEMIKSANDALDVCKGNIVFLTDTSDYSREINTSIRFINLRDYGRVNADSLVGFMKGIIASNSDVGKVYIDGLARILCITAEESEELFIALDDISEKFRVDFVISFTCDKAPKFMKKYISK